MARRSTHVMPGACPREFMKLAHPPHERVDSYKYKDHVNRAINRDKILSVHKTREHYYPDNEGIPVLRFWFGGKDYHDWYFDKGQENKRDALYRTLSAMKE
jgi:hypothetical protein